MGSTILVDGYNVIKNDSMLHAIEVKNLAVARQQLINQMVSHYKHTPHQVIVVFDGNGSSEQTSTERRVRIIYSRSGQTADRVIMRLAAEARAAGHDVEMYSNDGEVRESVSRSGGNVHSSSQLSSRLNAAPRDVAARAKHRMIMRRAYGIDPQYKDADDGGEPHRKTKNGKKKSSRRTW